jgi:hypothetical protein
VGFAADGELVRQATGKAASAIGMADSSPQSVFVVRAGGAGKVLRDFAIIPHRSLAEA